MLSLCANREEGFGPSSPFSSIPTTCFIDTIILPAPVFLYLALLPILVALTTRHFNPSTAHIRRRPSRSCLRTTTSIVYYALVIANILMTTLEIVRLALIKRSPDLLPFQYVALLLGGGLHFTSGLRGRIRPAYWKSANVFVWVGLTATSVVKTVGLVDLMNYRPVAGAKDFDRKGSKYPLSDQIIDVAVMAGVYLVVAVLEAALAAWQGKQEDGLPLERKPSEEGMVEPSATGIGWAK